MRFRSHQCWFPKELDAPRDYEDASSHSEKTGRAVIADGVSTAIFSRDWARLIARTAVVDPPDTTSSEALTAWLLPLQQEWRQKIGYDAVARDWIRGPKVKSVGAQATLLMVDIEPFCEADGSADSNGEYRLTAHAIGDCCLFLIRDGKKIRSFPMTDSAAFAAGPQVLSSIAKNVSYAERFEHLEDRCCPGDLLVVCTDAIGLWAMQQYEHGNTVDWMRYWENDAAWQDDIVSLRARGPQDPSGRMRVDDCTLLLLQVVLEEAVAGEPETQPDRSDEPLLLVGASLAATMTQPREETIAETIASTTTEADSTNAQEPEPQGEAVHALVDSAASGEDASSSETLQPGVEHRVGAALTSRESPADSGDGLIDEAGVTADEEAPVAGDAAFPEPHAQEPPGLFKRIFGFGHRM